MSKFLHPLLMMIASATEKELARHVQYLKEENQILRSKLPRRITVTPKERRRLLKFGEPLGAAIKELVTIVSPRTFGRWLPVHNLLRNDSRATRFLNRWSGKNLWKLETSTVPRR